jgi:hypothetical protein
MSQLILQRTGIGQQIFGPAEIIIDGKSVGNSNKNEKLVIDLAPGEYNIKVNHSWFESEETPILVYEQGDTIIEITGWNPKNIKFSSLIFFIVLVFSFFNRSALEGFIKGAIIGIFFNAIILFIFLRKSYIKVTPA